MTGFAPPPGFDGYRIGEWREEAAILKPTKPP